MRKPSRKLRPAFTLVEMSMSTAVTAVLVLVIGILFLTGNRAWQRSYAAANSRIKQDATGISLAFGSIGRRSSRLDYVLYNTTGDTLRPALPKTTNPEEVVWGDAIEFRYWDVPLDESDSHNLLDVTKTGTAYALFYLDDTQLKVDYGPYPPGAAPKGGGPRNTAGVTTQVLAENVSTENEGGAFSHTTLNGIGQGSVRIDVILTDPGGDEVINLTTATLLRSIWPR